MSYSETNAKPRRSIGTRLWWIVKTVIITFLILGVLLVLGSGAYYGLRELQRSFTSIDTRVYAQEQAISLLRSDVNGLMQDDPEQARQLETLLTDVEDLDTRLADLQSTVTAALATQGEALAMLTDDMAQADIDLTTVTSRTHVLEENIVALQSDINENTAQIDDLGGDIDAAHANVTILSSDVADLRVAADTAVTDAATAVLISDTVKVDVTDMQQTLVLFRAWELITRARLRLMENNVGLATSDVQTAADLLAALAPILPETEVNAIVQIQSRLDLILTNLPNSPNGAAQDLERAWDELDTVLAARIPLPTTTEGVESDVSTETGSPAVPIPTATASP